MPGDAVEDVDRAAAGAARGDAVEKKKSAGSMGHFASLDRRAQTLVRQTLVRTDSCTPIKVRWAF